MDDRDRRAGTLAEGEAAVAEAAGAAAEVLSERERNF